MCHIKIFFGKIFNDKILHVGTFGGRVSAVKGKELHCVKPESSQYFFTQSCCCILQFAAQI